MSKPSNQYFEKTENDVTCRIYLMNFDKYPWLFLSAFDANYGVHDELVERISRTSDALWNNIIDEYEHAVGFEKAHETARKVMISFIVHVMQAEGWTTFIE